MIHRKRQADERLSSHRSAKQPRTTLEGHFGGSPSPSELDENFSGWLALGREIWNFTRDMFSRMPQGSNDSGSLPFLNPQQSHPSPSSPPQAFILSDITPPPKFQRKLNAPNSQQLSNTQTTTSNAVSSHSMASISPSAFSGPSTSCTENPLSEPEKAPAASQPRGMNDSTDGIKRKYQNREHILAQIHKTKLQAELKRDRENMQKELYRYRRSSGYTQDFSTFKGYLTYRTTLEMLARQDVLSPSSSLTDLRSKPLRHTPSRRHSHSYDEKDFLELSLEKARATLNEPKPPKPFNPSLEQLRISQRVKDDEIERRLRPRLPSSLPPQDDTIVDTILRRRGVISKFAREQVTDHDLSRLRPYQWLNDEIINFYGAMILARSDACKENPGMNGVTHGRKKTPLNVHYFSTFFWSKLKSEGYEKGRLAKWTKKVDLFQKDIALIPVNHNNAHWTGAAINFRRKRIESYDSMGMGRQNVFKLLRLYLDAEHRNKKKKPFDFSGWEDYTSEETPQQENGFDCGVFTCQFLEALSRGEEFFNFSQRDMTYLRRRMIWEIGNAMLRDDP